MSTMNEHPIWKHFAKTFPTDPENLATLADVDALEQVPDTQRFPCSSVFEALDVVCREQGEHTALTFLPSSDLLTDKPRRWTYHQYRAEIQAAGNLFHALGIRSGESVVFMCPNIPEMLFGLWGVQLTGIATPVNPDLKPKQIAAISREADARVLMTWTDGQDHSFVEKAIAIQRENPAIEHIVVAGHRDAFECSLAATGPAPGQLLFWDDCIEAHRHEAGVPFGPVDGNSISAYFHTGGTTGVPKLAQHTHRAAVLNVCMMVVTGIQPEEGEDWPEGVVLSGLPLFHCNAMYVSVLSTLMSGNELVLAGEHGFRNPMLFAHFWPLIERYKVTFFSTVPTVYSALLGLDSGSYDTSSLICCSSGSAPISKNLMQEFHQRTGADIMEGYGMTELTAAATSHYYYGARPIGSVGMKLPYHSIRTVILDDSGNIVRDCHPDEVGVILHKGPTVISAYKQDFANEGAWPEPGWLNSGDMGRYDEEGFLWLTGRAKDLIIRGGHNIDPMITEDAVSVHPQVMTAAAVGKPDGYAGEVPIVYVELNEGAEVSAEALMAFAREHCAERAAAPKEVIILDQIPLTAVGKIFKPELRLDAISRAYREAAQAAAGDCEFSVQTTDDKTNGISVTLELTRGGTLENIEELIADPLNEFTYPWKLV
ncbi:acyl-CoA synthetase [Pseudomaricurvus alkylphenolicus]|uniref:acyl-CoA synthetase n=1 Tax=Pseudomaricurvus alkylphenolicus TaxID=1306991 RepID=UPI00141ECD84|nr:acyl-CoA synthetase [Pseudomaricurvus alkylphenolicus]NIB38141.1 acyl-CoA synthetase [Pseudomaricurvus alkylphenolicus]